MITKSKTYKVGEVEVRRICESGLDGFILTSLIPDFKTILMRKISKKKYI